MSATHGGLLMKLTIILAGILAVNSLAVAQGPAVTTTGQTNQVRQPVALPDTSRPQQSAVTNQTTGASATNAPSSTATSTNVSSASVSTNVSNTATTTSHPVTILRGSDATTDGSSSHVPPQKDSGLDPIKSTAGTPDDWRSGGSVPHVIPPRDPGTNP